MLLIVLFILMILLFFIVKNGNRNKYINIIVLYLFSTSMIILTGLLYKSRVAQYNFSVRLDYILYNFLGTLRFRLFTLSRLYNYSFALFMLSGALCIISLNIFRHKKIIGTLMIAPIVMFIIYNDPDFYKNFYLERYYTDSALYTAVYEFTRNLNKFIVYAYILAPFAALAVYYRRTGIFTKRRDSLIYGACIFIIDLYIYYICFLTAYRDIIFWNVDIARIPLVLTQFELYTNVMFITFVLVISVVILVAYFEPFNTISIINRNYKRETKREMEQNFSMVLHEYKNAFIGIKHFLNIADNNIEKENYDLVKKSVLQSMNIVSDNLESINRLGSTIGFHSKAYGKVDLSVCIRKALASYAVSDFARIDFEGFEDGIYVYGDEKRIVEVFENLFLNSVEAIRSSEKPNPKITISLLAEADAVMISITDNGIGIRKKDKSKIFSMFYSTKSGSNTGVGLTYVVKELQSYNGEIRVKSVYGEYTTMQIVLPLYRERRRLMWLKKSGL